MRIFFLIAGWCAGVICGTTLAAAETAPRPLRFVSDEAYPPLSFFHGTHPKGLGVDLARALQERLGRPVEVVLLPWSDAQAQVAQGQADFLGPMAITPQRQEKYDFTATFYQFEYVFLVRKDAPAVDTLKKLAGKRVGVTSGGYPRQRLKDDSALNLVEVENTEEAVELLRDGKIDAYAVDKWVASYELSMLGVHDVVVAGPPFDTRPSALAVKKGNAVLLRELDTAMAALQESGAYRKMLDRWQNGRVIVLSEQEQQRYEQRMRTLALAVMLVGVISAVWILFLRRQIAARRVSEQALKTTGERLRLALEATHDVIWDWDTLNDAQTWNAAGGEIFGWLDIVERPQTAAWWVGRVHPDDRERISASFHAVVDDPAQLFWEDEYRFRRSDGRYADVYDRGHVLRDGQGKAVRMVGAMMDISLRKQREQALLDSERDFRLLAEASPSGIWRTDATGANTYVSRRWIEITGLGASDARGTGWNAGVHPDDREAVYEGWLEAARHPEQGYLSEFRFCHPERGIVWVLCIARPEYSADGGLKGWIGTITDITVQKQAEMELRFSQQLLQRALDSMESHIAILDEQGTILTVNQRWRDFARAGSWSSHEYGIGENYLAACDRAAAPSDADPGDADAREVAENLRQLLAGRTDRYQHDYNCPDPAGNERWFRMSAIRFKHGDQSVRALIRHTEFTAERRRDAEQRRLVRAVESSDNTIFITDRHGDIVYANPAFAKHSGYAVEEALGRNPSFLHAPGETVTDFAKLWTTLMGGDIWTGTFRNRTKDGKVLWEDASLSPIKNEHGEIEHIVAVKENVTEKRALLEALEIHQTRLEHLVAERTAALQASESRARSILDSSADGMIGMDVGGTITFVNPAASRMLGHLPEELIGRNVHEAIHYRHADGRPYPVAECAVIHAIRAGKDLRNDSDTFWHRDGHALPVSMAIHPIFQGETVAGAVLSFIDISARQLVEAEREKAREAALQLAQVKSEFLANMSHEIRTPLNGVLGLAQIGYLDSQGRDKTRDTFARILDSGKLLLSIINDILDFSKLESGKLTIETIPFSPRRCVEESLSVVDSRAAAKGLLLAADFEASLPLASLGDPVRISQILLNFLSNAVKFTAVGSVTLKAGCQGDRLVFSVTDTGIGMTPEQRSRLFVPFEQADASTTRKYGGTGLGLSISQRLAELMGGEIRAENATPHGAHFQLRVPYVACDAEPKTAELRPPGREAQRLGGLRILAAEDNEVNQLVLSDMLEREGSVVTMVGNGLLAVSAVESAPDGYDLVLMDVQMPVMDGREATRRIRALAPDLPVIGQTAHALVEERDKCLEAGMADTLTKPLDLEDLVAVVGRHAFSHYARAEAPDAAAARRRSAVGEQAINWITLESHHPQRPEFIRKLIVIALGERELYTSQVRAAIDSGNPTTLYDIAHRIKGMAGSFAAHPLVRAATQLEAAAKHRPQEVPGIAEMFARQLDDFFDELERYNLRLPPVR